MEGLTPLVFRNGGTFWEAGSLGSWRERQGSSAADQTKSQQTVGELTDFRGCALDEPIAVHVLITKVFEDVVRVRESRAIATSRVLSLVGIILVSFRLPFQHFLDWGGEGNERGIPFLTSVAKYWYCSQC
jgi:hypothetical protein